MNIFFGIIIGLFVLMSLVVAHEFGHFIMARRNGVKVNEFGIGFPPRAIAWVKRPVEMVDKKTGEKTVRQKWVRIPKKEWGEKQDTLIFSLNWLPIGGFCSMDGESDADTKKGTFGAASLWSKTKILFGGVVMNWLVAFILLTVLAFTGMPQFLDHQFTIKSDEHTESIIGVVITDVIEGSPADEAGIKAGDYILGTGDEPTEQLYPDDVVGYINEHAGTTGRYYVRHDDGSESWVEVEHNNAGNDYVLGIEFGYTMGYLRYTWAAPLVGIGTTLQLTGETFRGLGEMLWNLVSGIFRQFSFDSTIREEGQAAIGSAGDAVSGPVGIIGVIFPAFASSGLTNLIFLTALISVSLACMNVLPIPALDGGRWLLIVIYRLRRKKLTKETEEKIVSRAFMVLMILIVVITVLDIIKMF